MFGLPMFNKGRGGWMQRNRSAAPIAADFGRSSMRLLQLASAGTEYKCTAAAEIAGSIFEGNGLRLDSAAMTQRIHETIVGIGFSGQRVTATLPAELFQTDIARLPAMTDQELTESVRFEAIDRFGIDGDSSVIGHFRLGGTAGGSNEVLMMAIPRQTVNAASAVVSTNDTSAFRIEHAALAALRTITRQRTSECADPAESRDFAMLHLEDRIATLVLLRDGALAFMRAIRGDWAPIGMTIHRRTHTGRTLYGNDTGTISMGSDGADDHGTAWRWCALAEETLRCLRHVEHSAGGWYPKEIVLTGPAATDPQAAATIESVCGVRSSLAMPIRMIRDPEACVHGNAWVAAIGAACSELPALLRNVRAPAEVVPQRSNRTAFGGRTTPRTSASGVITLDPEPKLLTRSESSTRTTAAGAAA